MRALLQGTFRSGVAAVFGIAERAGPAFHITQLYGHGGRLGGVYRKRHLGEGEEGYSTGEGAGVFQLGAARFGVTRCAEGEVDFPWTDAVAGGAAAGGGRRVVGWRRARTTWPGPAGSCARSWPATTSRSVPGSAGATTPSGWAAG
jgi:hypothetical protein